VKFSYISLRIVVVLLSFLLIRIAPETIKRLVLFLSLFICYVGSGIWNEKFKDPDPGSGMKSLRIRIRDPE
jgi:hypothetical protein